MTGPNLNGGIPPEAILRAQRALRSLPRPSTSNVLLWLVPTLIMGCTLIVVAPATAFNGTGAMASGMAGGLYGGSIVWRWFEENDDDVDLWSLIADRLTVVFSSLGSIGFCVASGAAYPLYALVTQIILGAGLAFMAPHLRALLADTFVWMALRRALNRHVQRPSRTATNEEPST